MASTRTVSGKHPLTVRVMDEDYKTLGHYAVEQGKTVNELLAEMAARKAAQIRKAKK